MGTIYRNGEMYGSNTSIDDTKTSEESTWSSKKIDNVINTSQSLKITSGSVNFSIIAKSGYRVGNHIHAEVYGTLNVSTSAGKVFTFFTINGIKKPTANKTVGSITINDSSDHPTLSCPSFVILQTDGYFTQNAKSSLTAGEKLGFIVDYYED